MGTHHFTGHALASQPALAARQRLNQFGPGRPPSDSMPRARSTTKPSRSCSRRCAAAWAAGWQPIELHRQGYRGSQQGRRRRLIALVIAVDHASQPAGAGLTQRGSRADRRAAAPPSDGRRRLARRVHWHARGSIARALVTIAARWADASAQPRDAARPSGLCRSRHGRRTADPVLAKIRALLAKAESTTFEAEALTFTAKAQELMTKHADRRRRCPGGAAHAGRGAERDPRACRPSLRKAKAHLLPVVAEASRCRTVHLGGCDLTEVVGLPSDLAGVDLLFTSLLVQAQTALMRAAGSTRVVPIVVSLRVPGGASASGFARSTTP